MRSLSDLITDLTTPFPSDQIELKPGVLTQSRDRALAMAYADSRVYQDRLDQVVGPADWHVSFTLTPDGVVCTLSILGVSKADVGDFPLDSPEHPNENRATSAAAQAFKRACAQFGLGRYLYSLPRTWADYDPDKRAFVHPQGVIAALYHAAGLAAFLVDDQPVTPRPDPARLATARAALASAEQRTGLAPATSGQASEAQLGLIARLIIGMLQQADEAEVATAINAIGEAFEIATLSRYTRKDALRSLHIAKPAASLLIQRLKELETPLATAA